MKVWSTFSSWILLLRHRWGTWPSGCMLILLLKNEALKNEKNECNLIFRRSKNVFSFTTSHHCDAGLTLVTWRSEFSWQRVGASTPGLHISTLHKSYLSIWAAINSPRDINLFQLFTRCKQTPCSAVVEVILNLSRARRQEYFKSSSSPLTQPGQAWKDYDLWGCHFYFPTCFKWCRDCCV